MNKNYRKLATSKLRAVAVVIAMAVVFATFADPVEASFFSFFRNLFGIRVYAPERIETTQTTKLLSADRNPFGGARGGGDITIVNKSALLPDAGPLGTIVDVQEAAPDKDQISIYVVRSGDTLSQIAKMFNVTVNTIIWSNDINRGDRIRIGQTLIILPVTGIRYTVKKSDTIKSIAKKYKGDADEIIQYNGLEDAAMLAVGKVIIIPNGELRTRRRAAPSYSNNPVRGAGGPLFVGYYQRPIYGGRKSQGLHGYNAVDLAAPCGTPIIASAGGRVIISRSGGWNAGYGNYVAISHPNNTQTLYAHTRLNIVRAGQNVVQGQVIGYIGSTGKSTGCHVHFEIRGAKNPF